jgi:hypothetical protein
VTFPESTEHRQRSWHWPWGWSFAPSYPSFRLYWGETSGEISKDLRGVLPEYFLTKKRIKFYFIFFPQGRTILNTKKRYIELYDHIFKR